MNESIKSSIKLLDELIAEEKIIKKDKAEQRRKIFNANRLINKTGVDVIANCKNEQVKKDYKLLIDKIGEYMHEFFKHEY